MNSKPVQVYFGLGGNLSNPLETLQKAFHLLKQLPQVSDSQLSRWYYTSPVGDPNQPHFVNAACRLTTTLNLKDLFRHIQCIEKSLGKVEKPKHAARPIDIDLLFYGDQSYRDHELIIPHASWSQRLFVLVPLADLTPVISVGSQTFKLLDLIHHLYETTDQKIWLMN